MAHTSEERLAIANGIIQQLGGRLTTMLGAYSIDATETGLKFRFKARASNSSNCCVVDLESSDTYTVKFISIRGASIKEKSRHTEIYAEDLKTLFERETGLALGVPRIVRV